MSQSSTPEPVPTVIPAADLVDLRGRRALVTGGGRGIGAAVAARLIAAGATVTVAELDPAAEDAVTATGAGFVACDITQSTAVAEALRVAVGDDGRLDILVNNAGIFPTTGPMREATDEFVARMLDVNVRAMFSVTRDASRLMGAGGAIVNLASITAFSGGPGISAYAASKAAVVSLTKSFARELGPLGIRVNAVAPGVIDTPGVQDQMEALRAGGRDISKIIAGNPIGVAGAPDLVARAVLFLVSDLAAFVAGHVLTVDGGATA